MAPWWLRSSSDEADDLGTEQEASETAEETVSEEESPLSRLDAIVAETRHDDADDSTMEEAGDSAPEDLPAEKTLENPESQGPAADDDPRSDPPEASWEGGEEQGEARPPRRRRRRRRRRRKPPTSETSEPAASPEPETAAPESPPVEAPPPKPAPAPKAPAVAATTAPETAKEFVYTLPERQVQDELKIAMFCDLENLALGVKESEAIDANRFKMNLVLERLLEKGKIISKRAYADWERYSEYKRPLHELAIELIDIPQKRYSGKNSADIKLVVDAMDLCYSKEHVDTFAIVSGDSDFSPLVSKLKENDKYVIGIGIKKSSSALLVDNCDEFIYYEDVLRDEQMAPLLSGLSAKDTEVFGLMVDAILALSRENKEVMWASMIKQTMKRKRPSFSEGYYGYKTFSELLKDAEAKQIVRLRRDQRAGTYVVTGFAQPG